MDSRSGYSARNIFRREGTLHRPADTDREGESLPRLRDPWGAAALGPPRRSGWGGRPQRRPWGEPPRISGTHTGPKRSPVSERRQYPQRARRRGRGCAKAARMTFVTSQRWPPHRACVTVLLLLFLEGDFPPDPIILRRRSRNRDTGPPAGDALPQDTAPQLRPQGRPGDPLPPGVTLPGTAWGIPRRGDPWGELRRGPAGIGPGCCRQCDGI